MFADINGARIHCEVRGSGTPVLLIGGFGAEASFWNHAVGMLEGDHTVITYDNRGVGDTEYGGSFSMTDLADDAAELISHLGFDSAHVLGWSMGSQIGQYLAAIHPDRVRTLTLVSTYLRRPSKAEYLLSNLTRMALDGRCSMDALAVAVNAFCFTEGTFRRFEDEGRRFPIPERAADPKGLMDQICAIGGRDTEDYARMIAVPTLVVHGTDDIMVGFEEGRKAADAIGGSTFLPIEGAGHNVLFDLYATEFRSFIDRS